MPRRPSVIRSRIAVVALLAAVGLGTVACAPTSDPTPSPSRTAEPEPSPTPEGPVLHPDGTAEDNLPLFTAVTEKVWKGKDGTSGRAYIDALVKAGFDKKAMQVTQDASTVGNAAESMQFSVRWGTAECLIGQVGPSTGEPVTIVMDQLAEGRCLIGDTRPIDW